MDVEPVVLLVVGGIGAVAGVLAGVSLRQRSQLLAMPVVPVERAREHAGDVVVAGGTTGEEITFPWTDRTGLSFSAKEVVEERDRRGGSRDRGSSSSRRRRSHDLGEAGLPLQLTDARGEAVVTVEPDGSYDVEHLPKLRTASDAGGMRLQLGPLNLGGVGDARGWVEEHAAFPGDTLYVAGTVAQRAGDPVITGKVGLAAKDPAAQGRVLLLRGGIAAVAALGFVGFALLLCGARQQGACAATPDRAAAAAAQPSSR